VHTDGAALVEQILLGRSGLALWLLDLDVVEFGLGLGQPGQGIGVGAQEPQHCRLLGADRKPCQGSTAIRHTGSIGSPKELRIP
jgi:hypothetical protein